MDCQTNDYLYKLYPSISWRLEAVIKSEGGGSDQISTSDPSLPSVAIWVKVKIENKIKILKNAISLHITLHVMSAKYYGKEIKSMIS